MFFKKIGANPKLEKLKLKNQDIKNKKQSL